MIAILLSESRNILRNKLFFHHNLRNFSSTNSILVKNVKYQSTSLDSVDLAKINPTENEKNLHKENCFQIKDVDFTDVHNAFQSKTNFDLLRGGVVYQLCKNSFLVDNAMKLSHFFEKVLGQTLFNRLMKLSFYGQFVAGENDEEVKRVTSKLQQFGVGSILDYAVEEELSEEEAKDLEMKSCTSSASEANPNLQTSSEILSTKRYHPQRTFGDRRKNVCSARTYFYSGEEKCDQNMEVFLKCIDSVSNTTDGGFAAIKLTALGRPQFLLQFSDVLMKGRELFKLYSRSEGYLHEQKFDFGRFQSETEKMGVLMNRDESEKFFTWMDKDENGFVDLLEWNEFINKNRKFSNLFVAPNPKTGEMVQLIPALNDEEEAQMKRMVLRINSLAEHALKKNVRLMVDAEQTYFQPAISRMVVEMMRQFNRDKTVIMNTYQCYLKNSAEELILDLELARRENFHFGVKLVRGAYMDHERERSKQLNYEDPIQASHEDTNENYNKNLRILMKSMKDFGKTSAMVASHNEDSVRFALQL